MSGQRGSGGTAESRGCAAESDGVCRLLDKGGEPVNEKTKNVLLVAAGVIILAVAVVSGLFRG